MYISILFHWVVGMEEVVIVTPIYKSDLSPEEQISINHLRRYASAFPRVIVHPIGLKFNFDVSDFKTIALSSRHFKSIQTYSRLCLNPPFLSAVFSLSLHVDLSA